VHAPAHVRSSRHPWDTPRSRIQKCVPVPQFFSRDPLAWLRRCHHLCVLRLQSSARGSGVRHSEFSLDTCPSRGLGTYPLCIAHHQCHTIRTCCSRSSRKPVSSSRCTSRIRRHIGCRPLLLEQAARELLRLAAESRRSARPCDVSTLIPPFSVCVEQDLTTTDISSVRWIGCRVRNGNSVHATAMRHRHQTSCFVGSARRLAANAQPLRALHSFREESVSGRGLDGRCREHFAPSERSAATTRRSSVRVTGARSASLVGSDDRT
jgi:hypothetical protein